VQIWLAVLPAGNGTAASLYVRPSYGAYSPDRAQSIKLPPTLYHLWAALTASPDQPLTYYALTRTLWPQATVADPELVLAHVRRLRALLESVGWPPGTLEVVWGRGVMFRAPGEPS
jgi:DNA-binding response OmpR family regulator